MLELIIPPALLQNLVTVPADRPVALLLRHSARAPIPKGETGNDLPLTDRGVELARELGVKLKGHLATLHTSPVRRCVETAEHLRDGAGIDCDIVPDRLLGAPGIFIENADIAWKTFQTHKYGELVTALIRGDDLVGMHHGPTAVRQLTEHMLAQTGGKPGIHVFVTHDFFVTTVAAVGLGFGFGNDESLTPEFLNGVLIWEHDQLQLRYNDYEGVIEWLQEKEKTSNEVSFTTVSS